MPTFLKKLLARLMAFELSRIVLNWFVPYVHDALMNDDVAFAALLEKYTDANYLNGLLATWYPKLPMARDFRVFGHTIRVPIREVLTPPIFALLMAAVATEEKAALSAARTALSKAYAAILAGTAPPSGT